MKIYISGAITGTSDYMKRFEEAEKELRACGYVAYNPASINSMMPEETTYEEYMKISLELLDICDGIYMLSGWEKSIGANREYGYALASKKEVFYQRDRCVLGGTFSEIGGRTFI